MKARLVEKVKVDALEMELGKVNKALYEAKLKLVQTREIEKAFVEVNEWLKELEVKVNRQNTEINRLEVEVFIVKETSIA